MIWPFIFTVRQWWSILLPQELLLLRKFQASLYSKSTRDVLFCEQEFEIDDDMAFHFHSAPVVANPASSGSDPAS
jgi:hypothetical protein